LQKNNNYVDELQLSSRDQKKLISIMDNCDLCSGSGYTITSDETGTKFVDCACTKKMLYYQKLLKSGIPERYIDWDIDKLYDQFKADNPDGYKYIIDYIDNLKNNIDNGYAFWLSSPPGLAKSSIASYITKKVIDLDFVAYFSFASKIIEKKFDALGANDNKEFLDFILYDTNFLVVEEIDKIYLKDDQNMANHLFYEFFLELYDQKKAVIITSNKTREEFSKDLPTYIKDRFATFDEVKLCGRYSGRR